MASMLRKAGSPTAAGLLVLLAAACGATAGGTSAGAATGPPVVPDVQVTRPPFDRVYVEFKETLAQGVVYVERTGPYNDVRAGVQTLLEGARARGLEPAGPLYVQFLEDPAEGSPDTPRPYRVGMPVDEPVPGDATLSFASEPGRTVVYAVVAGPFGSGRHAYAGLREFMAQWGWVQDGPVKELYGFPATPDGEFLTEVRIPWAPGS